MTAGFLAAATRPRQPAALSDAHPHAFGVDHFLQRVSNVCAAS